MAAPDQSRGLGGPTKNNWPTGRATPREELPITAFDVERVADFGETPSSALATPLYALRVFQRQRRVRSDLVRLENVSRELESKRDDLLSELANELLPTLEGNDGFRRALEPLKDVERLERERISALGSADADYRRKVERFDAQLAELQKAQVQAASVVLERQGLRDRADAVFRRADAKHKRALIDLRANLDVARRGLAPEAALPPAQAAQIAELEAAARAMEPQVALARQELLAPEGELLVAQGDLKDVIASLKTVEREKVAATAELEKEAASAELKKQRTALAQGVPAPAVQKRDALVSVGRSILAAEGALSVRTELIEAIRAADLAQERAAIQAETHLRALDSHDRGRATLGARLSGALLACVVLLILLKAVL